MRKDDLEVPILVQTLRLISNINATGLQRTIESEVDQEEMLGLIIEKGVQGDHDEERVKFESIKALLSIVKNCKQAFWVHNLAHKEDEVDDDVTWTTIMNYYKDSVSWNQRIHPDTNMTKHIDFLVTCYRWEMLFGVKAPTEDEIEKIYKTTRDSVDKSSRNVLIEQ